MKLNLTANNIPEERIKEYLEQNASPTLAEKINFGTPITKDGKQLVNRKTLQGFFKYAGEEARKVAQKGANFACIDDNTVFGWAIHYFEEEAIEGELFNLDGTPYAPKTTAPKTVPPDSKKKPQAPKPTIPKAETKKYSVIAYADEDGNKRQEAIIEAENKEQAESKAWRMFPEHHEIGVWEQKPEPTPEPKPGTKADEPKKAVILPPIDPNAKPKKNTDKAQLSIFDLF